MSSEQSGQDALSRLIEKAATQKTLVNSTSKNKYDVMYGLAREYFKFLAAWEQKHGEQENESAKEFCYAGKRALNNLILWTDQIREGADSYEECVKNTFHDKMPKD